MHGSESQTWAGPVVPSLSHMWRLTILWACPQSYISIQTHWPLPQSTLDTGEHAHMHLHIHTSACVWSQYPQVLTFASSAPQTGNSPPHPCQWPVALFTQNTVAGTHVYYYRPAPVHPCAAWMCTPGLTVLVCLRLKGRVRKHLEPGLCGIHNISQENIPCTLWTLQVCLNALK